MSERERQKRQKLLKKLAIVHGHLKKFQNIKRTGTQ